MIGPEEMREESGHYWAGLGAKRLTRPIMAGLRAFSENSIINYYMQIFYNQLFMQN